MRAVAPDPPPYGDLMPALTGVRLPLALWVVIHHLSGPGRMFASLGTASATAFALIDAAWVALSVFFAISGFVLARRYHATSWDRPALARYAVARFGRVYPVYLFSLLILVPIIGAEVRGGSLGSPAEQTGLLLNHLLLLQGWQRPGVDWNTPAWSLSCEVFFYALFPLVVVLVRRATWPRLAAAACVAFGLPMALRLLLEPPIAKPLLYFGDFLIGLTVGMLYECLRASRVRLARLGPWLSGPALAGGLLLLLFRESLGSFLAFDAGVRLTSAMLVFGLACGGGLFWRCLSSPLMVGGGQAAYAIYILHVPVLWWYERSHLHSVLPPVTAGVVYLAVVVALSLVVSRHVEEPANAIIRRWFALRRTLRTPAGPVAAGALPLSRSLREG